MPMAIVRIASASLCLMLSASPGWAQAVIAPPVLGGDDTAKTDKTADPNGNYCRPPQRRTDSRLPGPQVCLPIAKWNAMHAAGLDIGPDGTSVVPMQKNLDPLIH
jgi:hypothetical protein